VSAHRPEHLSQAAAWVVGSLDPDERREFEAHLAGGCAECEAEIARLNESATLLAASAPPARPSPAVRARVMAEVRRDAAARAAGRSAAAAPPATPGSVRVIEFPRPRRPWAVLAWAAAAVLLAVFSILSAREVDRLKGEAAGLRDQIAKSEKELADERHWVEVLSAPDARTAELTATPDAAGALRARATFDPRTHGAVIVFQGLKTPSDRDFELWALRGNQAASLGLIHADANGNAVVRIEVEGEVNDLVAFAVSLEQKGGSPTPTAPTGPVVMVGKLSG
jgi:anti-sigma-K factor RskA